VRLLLFAALIVVLEGVEHRYFIVDGPAVIQVGAHFWHRTLAEGWCSRVEHKAYPRLKNHLCYFSGERLRATKKVGPT
jgi:hypothetical protein